MATATTPPSPSPPSSPRATTTATETAAASSSPPASPTSSRRQRRRDELERQQEGDENPSTATNNTTTTNDANANTNASITQQARSPSVASLAHSGGSVTFLNDFGQRASVANIHREVDGGGDNRPGSSSDVRVFQEAPHVRVVGGRSEDSWPTRYVEYDVELTYRTFKWHVEIPKSTIYGLWFFVKSKMHSLSRSTASGRSVHEQSATTATTFPQMRKLFLANSEKSTSPEMVMLVQQYLEAVVAIPALLHSAFVVEMFEVSNSTFDDEEGCTSTREGWLRVRMWLKGNQENVRINRGAMTCDNECFNCMCVVKRVHFRPKKWGWVALKHTGLAVYPSIQDTRADEMLLFDAKFNVERGIHATGSNTSLVVSNATYVMQLEAKTKQSIVKWANCIRKTAEKSEWSQSHRSGSFAIPRNPTRMTSFAKWFVDGNGAYESIYETLRSAKKEIFIAGWWVCPTIHLLRPAADNPHSRLDTVLQQKAKEGVKVYILMYKEVAVALSLNSNYSKQVFRRLHENVHVLRDPDFLMKQLGMWSHHEKIVSVDQKVTFVGGLDLCFGRWDTHSHELFDEEGAHTNFVGKDYSNPRVKDFVDLHQPEKDMIDRDTVPRMPWHDCHCRLEGQPARDVARHFIQRWNYSVSTRSKKSKLHHLVPMKDYPQSTTNANGERLLTKRLQKAMRAVRVMGGLRKGAQDKKKKSSKWPDMSSLQAAAKSQPTTNEEGGDEDSQEQTQAASGEEEPKPRGFNLNRRLSKMLMNSEEEEQQKPEEEEPEDKEESESDEEENWNVEFRGYPAHCQVLRSVSLWSAGVPTEHSIQNTYIRLIGAAEHFIYIENQFFVSGIDGDPACSNRIASALVERIRRAAANNEPFRVIVVMPLLPAFPGKVGDKESSSLRGVMYWQYRTICRGEHSIYNTLLKELADPFEYLAFFGLRTYNINNGHPRTEEVYVHSKVMIVDDRACIIGSANINERSMTGDRDSEIAVVVEDSELDDSIKIGNGAMSVGKFGHSFRMQLFKEHFGLVPGSAQYKKYSDPVSSDAWFSMQEQATRNYQIYESVFGCLPSDSVSSFKQIGLNLENGVNNREAVSGNTRPVSPATGTNSHGFPEKERRTTKAANQEEPVDEEQVELTVENEGAAGSPPPRKPTSVSPPGSPTSETRADNNSTDAKKPVGLTREDSEMLSGVIHLNMREDEQIDKRKEELNEVQGHVVYFPLQFLKDEALEPALYPAELFQ